ncbi:MAG: hypothetical protein GIW98_03715 [Candidatus Eremiobacteraeota bacterium]|nr:hypothetical protein [Candidatus Eremiobacteraeota bacterium]
MPKPFGERSVMPDGFFMGRARSVRRRARELMDNSVQLKDLTFDAYTICSFMPTLESSRAIPLVLIGYRKSEDPSFVWLVPKHGLSGKGLTNDPYYAKVLRDPHSYFTRKLRKYIEETGSVRRGIEMLIDCHQNHLAFTELVHMDEVPFTHPIEVELVGAV